MAARWSAWALILQLLLAAALAAALAHACALSGAAIAGLIVLELCGGALLLAVAPLALGRWKASGPMALGAGNRRLRALCADALSLELALGRMALEPCRPPVEDRAAPTAPGARPILLVHGFACSRAVWRPLLKRLAAAGVRPVRAVSLEPLFAGVDACAAQVLSEIEALAASCAGEPVTIVGHSMGGLVARAALRAAAPGRIGRIVTLGAPHHGTALACWFGWPSTRQMCPGSDWLAQLNCAQAGRPGIPITTIYSLDDNFIVPAGSARLDGAQLVEFRGLGHLSLLDASAVLDRVVSEALA